MKIILKKIEFLLTVAIIVMIVMLVQKNNNASEAAPQVDMARAAQQYQASQNMSALAQHEAHSIMQSGDTKEFESALQNESLIGR